MRLLPLLALLSACVASFAADRKPNILVFCSPTRAGLLTGRYQQRFGHENNPVYNPADATAGLPLTEKILPQFMHEAGYKTGWIGKWHLGATPAHTPWARGFDETYGFIGGGHVYSDWQINEKEYNVPLTRNGQPTAPLFDAIPTDPGCFIWPLTPLIRRTCRRRNAKPNSRT
ncbi:MAG: hypothetical protein EBS64_08455 [Verrucomicrobia bacterium]|nr:hypothetical protein [Verrucomicrobiota bacterium]